MQCGANDWAGGMLEEAAKQGEKLKLNGSAFIAVAESKEEVLEVLRKDVYAESGIWDMSKVWVADSDVLR